MTMLATARDSKDVIDSRNLTSRIETFISRFQSGRLSYIIRNTTLVSFEFSLLTSRSDMDLAAIAREFVSLNDGYMKRQELKVEVLQTWSEKFVSGMETFVRRGVSIVIYR